jgi:hypothetical protein
MKKKYEKLTKIAAEIGINISERKVRKFVERFLITGNLKLLKIVIFKHYQKRSETFKDVDERSKNDHLAVRYSTPKKINFSLKILHQILLYSIIILKLAFIVYYFFHGECIVM